MTKADNKNFKILTKYWARDNECNKWQVIMSPRKYRGSAHRGFNIKFELNYKFSVIIQNLKNYKSHLIMQELGNFNYKINVIQSSIDGLVKKIR